MFSGVNLDLSNIITDIGSIQYSAFKLDFAGLFDAHPKIILSITGIVSFVFTDIFDTLGTLIGTGKRANIFTKEELEVTLRESDVNEGEIETTKHENVEKRKSQSISRFERTFFGDMIATTLGSLIGTSNVVKYVENAAGIVKELELDLLH